MVVAGGEKKINASEPLDSVELLDPTGNNEWTLSQDLPMKLKAPVMVTSPTGQGESRSANEIKGSSNGDLTYWPRSDCHRRK